MKVNQQAIKSKTVNPYLSHVPAPPSKEEILDEILNKTTTVTSSNIVPDEVHPAFFDSNIHVRNRERKAVSFKFVEEGSLIKAEEKTAIKVARQEVLERIHNSDDFIKAAYEGELYIYILLLLSRSL